MQSVEQIELEPDERRMEPRKQALMHAFISDQDEIADLKCVILDISRSGCRIASSYIEDLPGVIEITPEGFDRPMSGKIVWRNEKMAGVEFLNPGEIEAYERDGPAAPQRPPAAGFLSKLNSLAAFRRRSGQATRAEHRDLTGVAGFGMRVLHGVRHPLTAIKGLLRLLMGDTVGPIPRKARTIINAAHQNAGKAEALVGEALHAVRISSGTLPFSIMPVEIVALVNNSVVANTGFAAKNDVRFEISDSVENAMVEADPVRLDEVLTNLLASAAKNSPLAETVRVSIARVDGSIRIAVSDKGLGSTLRRGEGDDAGCDLDMTICRSVLARHDSELHIDARPGAGTTVWFELHEAA